MNTLFLLQSRIIPAFASSLRSAFSVLLIAIFGLAALSSCATISGYKEYTVNFTSVPEKADVKVTDERGKVVFTGQTPTYANLPTSAGYFQGKHYTATFTKEGSAPVSAYLQHEVSGLYVVGNSLFGGVLGWLLADPISGGMWRLPTNVEVKLGDAKSNAPATPQTLATPQTGAQVSVEAGATTQDTVVKPAPTRSWGRISLGSNLPVGSETLAFSLGAVNNIMMYYEVLPRFALGYGVEAMLFRNFVTTQVQTTGGVMSSRIPVNAIAGGVSGSMMYRFQDSPLATPYLSLSATAGVGLSILPSIYWNASLMGGYQWMLGDFLVFAEGGALNLQGQNFATFSGFPTTYQGVMLQGRVGVNFWF
ncbi:MAG: hypothetical protein EAZ92_12865 [Candidatus Kapaibacterium sp.]|nr:MAG: hypothetical protein EAZ92_12865 [Candidatus Kapabacteria bacterium]